MPILKSSLKNLSKTLAAIKMEESEASNVPVVSAVQKFPVIDSNKGNFDKILHLISRLGKSF